MPQQPQTQDQTKNAIGLIDAFTRDFASFISGLVGVTAAVQPQASLGRPVVRWFCIPDGAAHTFTITEDCFFLGIAGGYTSYQVTLTTDGSTQTSLVSGTFRELPECLASVGIANELNGNMRTFLLKGTSLTISVNTGPQIVGVMLELPQA